MKAHLCPYIKLKQVEMWLLWVANEMHANIFIYIELYNIQYLSSVDNVRTKGFNNLTNYLKTVSLFSSCQSTTNRRCSVDFVRMRCVCMCVWICDILLQNHHFNLIDIALWAFRFEYDRNSFVMCLHFHQNTRDIDKVFQQQSISIEHAFIRNKSPWMGILRIYFYEKIEKNVDWRRKSAFIDNIIYQLRSISMVHKHCVKS